MGLLLKRSRGSPITVRVVDDTHSYTVDDGSKWWSGGYAPVYEDEDGEHYFISLGEYLSDSRVLYCKVAGAHHHPLALQDVRFETGSAAVLRPEPDNPYDADAVGVWDGSGSVQLGHRPADLSTDVASRIRVGEQLVAFVLRENPTRLAVWATISTSSAGDASRRIEPLHRRERTRRPGFLAN